MTEEEWLASEDPADMLEWYRSRGYAPGFGGYLEGTKPSNRKLRLIAVACSRHLQAYLNHDKTLSNMANVQAERWADSYNQPDQVDTNWYVLHVNIVEGLQFLLNHDKNLCHHKEFAHIFRDIAGNLFRLVTLPGGRYACRQCGAGEAVLHAKTPRGIICHGCGSEDDLIYKHPWLTPTVLSLAKVAYKKRLRYKQYTLDPARLAVLSDALEEVDCVPQILDHLRSPGPHHRGCWVLDLLLSKE